MALTLGATKEHLSNHLVIAAATHPASGILAGATTHWLIGTLYMAVTLLDWLDVALYHVLSTAALCHHAHSRRYDLYCSTGYRTRYYSSVLYFWSIALRVATSSLGAALLALTFYPTPAPANAHTNRPAIEQTHTRTINHTSKQNAQIRRLQPWQQ